MEKNNVFQKTLQLPKQPQGFIILLSITFTARSDWNIPSGSHPPLWRLPFLL